MKPLLLLVLSLGLVISPLHAAVRLPAIISDRMVLEKTARAPIWGWADPGEEVTVTLDGQSAKTQAGADGKWRVNLNLEKSAQGPFEMMVEGNKVVVWSSNMKEPIAVRYGWADNPTVNLYNEAGLPASPFRTDDFELITHSVGF